MYEYYDAMASVYEQSGPPSFELTACKEEIQTISKLLPLYISGNHIDLACGTGMWLPSYEANCSDITLIDQSARMLSECTKKIKKLGIETRTRLIHDTLFSYPFQPNQYDSALIGLFISHLTKAEEQCLFAILKSILKPDGKFVIIDSAWGKEIAVTYPKAGLQKRVLRDGREFEIYKKYFKRQDFYSLARTYGLKMTIIHEGRIYITVVGNIT